MLHVLHPLLRNPAALFSRGAYVCTRSVRRCNHSNASQQGSTIREEAQALERIVLARRSSRRFDPERPVPDAVLGHILALTQRAPSGFNLQPYRVVVVSNPVVKARLSQGMLGGNAARVESAPVCAVFAADTQPMLSLPEIMELEANAGKSSRYLRSLPFDVGVLTAGRGGAPAQCVKSAAINVASRILPLPLLPTVPSAEAWAFKSTAFAAQTLLLAAAAHGLGSHVMEGLNAPAVRDACRIPQRYAIPFVVALGYEAPAATSGEADDSNDDTTASSSTLWSPRLPPERVYSKDTFGVPLGGIIPLSSS